LVVRGEPGVGKTALLEYLVEQASGCRVVRAAGVQSEAELAFAVLHQLLAPASPRAFWPPAFTLTCTGEAATALRPNRATATPRTSSDDQSSP
jgi:hypothetical protein